MAKSGVTVTREEVWKWAHDRRVPGADKLWALASALKVPLGILAAECGYLWPPHPAIPLSSHVVDGVAAARMYGHPRAAYEQARYLLACAPLPDAATESAQLDLYVKLVIEEIHFLINDALRGRVAKTLTDQGVLSQLHHLATLQGGPNDPRASATRKWRAYYMSDAMVFDGHNKAALNMLDEIDERWPKEPRTLKARALALGQMGVAYADQVRITEAKIRALLQELNVGEDVGGAVTMIDGLSRAWLRVGRVDKAREALQLMSDMLQPGQYLRAELAVARSRLFIDLKEVLAMRHGDDREKRMKLVTKRADELRLTAEQRGYRRMAIEVAQFLATDGNSWV
jgi:transcriptional regulator with XRE-family HTH domain